MPSLCGIAWGSREHLLCKFCDTFLLALCSFGEFVSAGWEGLGTWRFISKLNLSYPSLESHETTIDSGFDNDCVTRHE